MLSGVHWRWPASWQPIQNVLSVAHLQQRASGEVIDKDDQASSRSFGRLKNEAFNADVRGDAAQPLCRGHLPVYNNLNLRSGQVWSGHGNQQGIELTLQ
jgi:hypothetical protein